LVSKDRRRPRDVVPAQQCQRRHTEAACSAAVADGDDDDADGRLMAETILGIAVNHTTTLVLVHRRTWQKIQ